MTAAVLAEGLVVSLGGTRILRGIDLEVADGEVVALLGANGSGKSTLVRALVGVVPIESGRVELFERPLGRSVEWRRIGYVPQRVSAGSGVPATAGEVVASGLLTNRRLRLPRRSAAAACEALDLVGLADEANRAVRELSGGQQQRVLIARALIRTPDLLLLDEPVAGVDLTSQTAFARALSRLTEQGTTVLVVLHELGALAPLVRRAIVLRHGAVAHDGAPPLAAPGHGGDEHDHVHPHPTAEPPRVGAAPEMRLTT
jgi:zinc transport system ATP-binding protein